ncbi:MULTISPECIES: hypothetical protein [Bacillus cereus group]|uniref:hypothetical protein n=1 Tax=Bacillus cereus group TaxID=86661 RepID=UPI000A202C5D|nr:MULTISPECIES: hypothetical protein [Bacillus cereus group]ARO21476.1 hypothetical protein B2J90_29215 [Bacillus cereus]MBJ8109114.1 hypothetical protein [Bacillus cereus group sp. N6]MDA1977047.1 hypothetical protein [Bacillus cereus]TNP19109.1 hypothetical protein FHY73_15615 [Bacillus tropicus]
MGDLADDCYEAAMREMFSIQEAVTKYTVNVPDQKVIDDVIQSFKDNPVDESDKHECLARDILITVARTKTLSIKQKTRLVMVLVDRYTVGYECNYDL